MKQLWKTIIMSRADGSMLGNNLTEIRLLCAALVVLHHINILGALGYVNPLFQQAAASVNMFFIISGMFTTLSLHRSESVTVFAIKRVFKIYPLYLTVVLFQVLLGVLMTTHKYDWIFLMSVAKYFCANALFMNFIQPTIIGVFDDNLFHAINGSLWTIKVFVMFYATLPFIDRLYKKYGVVILGLLYVLSIIYSLALDAQYGNSEQYQDIVQVMSHQYPAALKYFIVGMCLYYNFGAIIRRKLMFTILGVGLIIIQMIVGNNVIFRQMLAPVTLGVGMFCIGFFIKPLGVKSDWSFAIYLWHFPIIQMLLATIGMTTVPLFVLTVILTLVISAMSHRWIELTMVQYSKKIAAKDYCKRTKWRMHLLKSIFVGADKLNNDKKTMTYEVDV